MNIKDIYTTKVTVQDLAIAEKDEYGVYYSRDGKRLLGIERKDLLPLRAMSYKIKEGTEVICDYAFSDSFIQNITIPDSLVIIGKRSFEACRKLHQVIMGRNIKTIKEFAFNGCIALKDIILPDYLETIETMAFKGSGLKELTIPLLCRKITGNPIPYKNIKIKSKSPHFIVDNDILFTTDKHELISFQSSISLYTIPSSVTRIGNYAFFNCTNLRNVVIPSSVIHIGKNPFACCRLTIENMSKEFILKEGILIDNKKKILIGCYSKNESINIPNGITTIGECAFLHSKVAEIKLPYSVISIKEFAFQFCTIEKIKLPNSVKFLGDFAFSHCHSLQQVNIPKYIDYYGKGIFADCHSLQTINLPDVIKYIKMGMFFHCFNLENITISNSVTKIYPYAFYVCKNLKEIIIPKSVQYIGKYAFFLCENLKATYIPDTVNYIGIRSFSDCRTINLIATTPGNKNNLIRMLPKYLHRMIKEMTYKEFVNRKKSLYSNVNTEEEYDFGGLERVKCPRCGNWYFEDDGVCDICGYPWNE